MGLMKSCLIFSGQAHPQKADSVRQRANIEQFIFWEFLSEPKD
jgi:hypothetical protein